MTSLAVPARFTPCACTWALTRMPSLPSAALGSSEMGREPP